VHAIAGNVDAAGWLPSTLTVVIGECRVHLVHRIVDLEGETAEYDAVIYGHSHKPSIEQRGRVLFLNPGSAGPRRFRLPVTIARLRVNGRSATAEIVTLLHE
jgi:putative phosphoesterase